MTQTRQRSVAAGRDADAVGNVQTGRLHDYTTYPVNLPPNLTRHYWRTCAAWATNHAHYRAIVRLLEMAS
jgi:hypothetical protein